MCYSTSRSQRIREEKAAERDRDDTWRRFERETQGPAPIAEGPREEREPEKAEDTPTFVARR